MNEKYIECILYLHIFRSMRLSIYNYIHRYDKNSIFLI